MTAKEMFEKLGYEYKDDYELCLFRYVNCKESPYVYIYFYINKRIEVATDYSLSYEVFQAINEQVEELGWLRGEDEK